MANRFLRRAARWVARRATRYVTRDAFELQRPGRNSRRAEVTPPGVYDIVLDGIEMSFNRIPMYAGLARMLKGVDLGDVVEFGGSSPSLSRLLEYRSWNIAPNYPEVDIANLERYADASCDTVVLDNILEHVSDPRRGLAECARVLQPGGRLIAAVPFLVPVHAAPDDYSRWTPEGFARVLRNHFDRVVVEAWGNREALRLLIDSGAPEGWPTFEMARGLLGDARAWLLLHLNEQEWPITIWAVATTAATPAPAPGHP
ncbi:MAG TPA: methyltransferase domain-containing protein [Myxococcota bacterium]|nr:methyltransferase domain-containing protein [Myxococcota bacterium]